MHPGKGSSRIFRIANAFAVPSLILELLDSADVVIYPDDLARSSLKLLEDINKEGLFTALEKGIFGDVKRPKNGGKGLEGVTMKGENYLNPFVELMKGKR